MTATEAARLAKLERDFISLEQRFRALELNTAKPPAALPKPPVEQDGVRFFSPILRATIDQPGEFEAKKLIAIVGHVHPKLLPACTDDRYADGDRAEFLQNFRAAFDWVACQGRADEVDTKQSIEFWALEASDYYRRQGRPINIGAGALLAAVLAAGDVRYIPSDELGNVWSIGLATFGGRPATGAWQRVLKDGRLLPPTAGRIRALDTGSFGVRQGG